MDEERLTEMVRVITRADEMARALAAAGSGQGAVGPATTAGERSVIPLTETFFAGGYGGGGGADSAEDKGAGAGGGGGGFGRSRTVAVVEVSPDGVAVRPVVDTTAIVVTAIATGVGLLTTWLRTRRGG